ncbi:MAG TPA: BTAD domain-containing putative transcriptional regulator [Gemmatimonadota bacterium]|nr:BTAD domain-containing putative transcriptional regulator [Gemmatimonadota bacterium]
MSTTPEAAPPRPPLRLQTFGTLVLRGAEGDTLWADYGQQGWRLALLAVLAAAGDRGCSRDRLLLLFWPDASQQQARHSLEQLLYKMRKSLSASPFLGVNPLRLDPSVVSSDLADFETALAAGDPETAIGRYGGPFLDGFYLGDSPEFEEWMIGERSRLEAEHARALERLAQAAESKRDHEAAVGWWRKLFALDSLSGRNALGLMRALANSGDHAAALRHAEQYERRVEQELGTNAGPEIAALATEIRARAREEPLSVGGTAPTDLAPRTVEPIARRPPTTVHSQARIRRPLLITGGALALAAVVFAATRLRDTVEAPAAAAVEPSIAVLPLANLSADPADDALADGMTEELIAVLGRASDLRVIASTSVFALKDRQLDVRQIADSLSVSHIVEGGLQRVGSRLRIQVRLVDARDGSTRWSETYDREFEDVFAVQAEIARAVAGELDARLVGGGRPGSSVIRHQTQNIAAYEWYLRGIDVGYRQHRHTQAAEYFRRAIAADSSYAAAYAGLVRMLILMSGGRVEDVRLFSDAEDAARTALALDDSLAEAHEAMGWVHMVQMDFPTAESDFQRAIALDPRYSHAHEGLAHLYLWMNRPEEQLAEARLALENDPFSHTAIREMGRALLVNGRYDEARDRLRPLKALSPPVGYAGLISGQSFITEGRWPEAIAELRWAQENDAGSAPAFLGYALARGGRRDEAKALLSDLLTGTKYSHGAFGIAVVYAGLEDYDQAFAWLDRALEDNTVTRDLMLPMFQDLHTDPRFERVKARLGLSR